MKALGYLPVADEDGDELRAAGLMRFLNETMWFPAALLKPYVAVFPIDDGSFGLRATDRAMSVEGALFVDDEGRAMNFRAQRFNTTTRRIESWETPITSHGLFDGFRLPSAGAAVWKLPTGDFTYIELEISSVRYED